MKTFGLARLIAVMTAISAFTLTATGAHAQVVLNNGGPNNQGGNETTQWVQSEDFSFNTATTVGGAGVYLAGIGGISNYDGNFQYYIFGDNMGNPGNILASGSVTPTVSNSGTAWCCGGNAYLFEFNFTNFLASANAVYHLGIHASGSSDFNRDEIYWVSTSPNATAPGIESQGGTFNNWNSNGVEHAFYLLGANANGAVPEPATWAMLILGFGAIGFALRRRSKQQVRVRYAI